MSVIYIVLPFALLFVLVAVFVFIRAVRKGQFDDLDTPGLRVLQDENSGSRSGERPKGDSRGPE